MKTLLLRDGDLVVGPNGHETVSGPRMIAQDLRCALMEPVGNDRFHPLYGSRLESLVGSVAAFATFEAEQEVSRVVGQYVAVQRDKIERDALTGTKSRFSTDDVVDRFEGTRSIATEDRVFLQVLLRTAAGTSVPVVTSASL